MYTCIHSSAHYYVNYVQVHHTHTYVYVCMCNLLISFIEILLAGPDPNTFIAVTVTLTSLSTAGKSIVAIGTLTLTELSVILSPE